MSNQLNKLLHIATLGKTVGLKGDIKLHINSDFPEQFKKGVSFFIDKGEQVTFADINSDKTVVKIVGFESPESVKKLTNKKIYTTMERTRAECNLADGEYFWFDLEGCRVVEDGVVLGVVDEIERITTTNYLFVKTDDALVSKGLSKSFLIPFCKPFALKTDISNSIIEVSGALDILEAS